LSELHKSDNCVLFVETRFIIVESTAKRKKQN
jgi:hypothetical protein